MYCSNSDDKIFQTTPLRSKPSAHKLKSWTDTVEGYLNEANKLTTCLFRNRRLANEPYTWFLTIYVDTFMAPNAVNLWWRKAARNLQRHGVIALWVREPTRTNKVHYHVLIRSKHARADLIELIETSLPNRKLGRWHKNLKQVTGSDWRLLRYITKAKTPGKTKSGHFVTDLYARKRLLFKPNLGIRKVGTIGDFWLKSKRQIWDDIRAREKRIADGLADDNVKKLTEYAYDFLGGAVPLQQIQRRIAYFSDSPNIQQWIEQLLEEENRPPSK